MSKRIRTYISGFDEVIGEGLPEGHVILFVGSAGAMKSSLSFYILYNNAIENGLGGMYVCLEEEKESFKRNMGSLGMDFEKVSDRILIFDAGDRVFLDEKGEQMAAVGWLEGSETESTFMRSLKYVIKRAKEKNDMRLLVIDSLDSLVLLSGMADPRDELFKFFEWLKELSVTVIIIGEMPNAHPAMAQAESGSEDFLADGIIHIRMEKVGDVTYRRYIRCVKMRGTEHSPDYFVLVFDGFTNRFEVTKAIY